MNVTFKDSKKQRKWTYNNITCIYAYMNSMRVVGWDDNAEEEYSARHNFTEFDGVELDISEEVGI